MQEALDDRIRELSRSRADYDDLLDQCRRSARLFDEKESLYKDQLKQYQSTIEAWKDKYNRMKAVVQEQNSLKSTFQKDAMILEETARLLDQREKDLQQSMDLLKGMNSKLETENNEQKELISRLQEEQEELRRQCNEEMVNRIDHDNALKKLQALQHIIEFDMISNLQYEQLVDDNRRLKQRIEQHYVDRESFEDLQQRLIDIEREKDTEFVKKSDFLVLEEEVKTLHEDKQLLETSVRIVTEIKDQLAGTLQQTETKLQEITHRNESSERDLQQLVVRCEHLSSENGRLQEEVSRREEERQQRLEQTHTLEQTKSQLLTQLGQLKLSLRSETDSRREAVSQLKACEERAQEVKTQFSKSLIENNQKLNEVFAVKERQFVNRIKDLEKEQEELRDELDSVRQELNQSRAVASQSELVRTTRERDYESLLEQFEEQKELSRDCNRERESLKQNLVLLEERNVMTKSASGKCENELITVRERLQLLETSYQALQTKLAVKETQEENVRRELTQAQLVVESLQVERDNLSQKTQESSGLLEESRFNLISVHRELTQAQLTVSALQVERDSLVQKVQELSGLLEELRVNVMSELSPSFKHFYTSTAPPHGSHTLFTPSQAVVESTFSPSSPSSVDKTRERDRPPTPSRAAIGNSLHGNEQPRRSPTAVPRSPTSPLSLSINPLAIAVSDSSLPSTSIPRTNTPPRRRFPSPALSARQVSCGNVNMNGTRSKQSRFEFSLDDSVSIVSSPAEKPSGGWRAPVSTPMQRQSNLTRQLLQSHKTGSSRLREKDSLTLQDLRADSPRQLKWLSNPAVHSPVASDDESSRRRSVADSEKMDDHSVVRKHSQMQ